MPFRKKTMDALGRLDTASYRSAEKLPVVIVLDQVRSALNVGSVFRTADAFRAEAIYLCGLTACPPHREIEKTALGATESVSWKHFPTAVAALEELRSAGYYIVAVEQALNSVPLGSFVPPSGRKLALVFGHEVHGVSHESLTCCDACIEIPQSGTKHSLNVSVSAGIVLWDITCKTAHPIAV